MNTKQEIQLKHSHYLVDQVILSSKEEALVSLKDARCLVAGMIKMIEEGRPCVDIMQKNLDAVAFLRRAHKMIMENNLSNCFKKAGNLKDESKNKETREEMIKVMKMFYK